MWYTDRTDNENLDYTFTHFHDEKNDWIALMHRVRRWLNCNLLPEELVTVSLFEDEHGSTNKRINAVVTHTAELLTPPTEEDEECKEFHDFEMEIYLSTGDWDTVFNQAKTVINHYGACGDYQHAVASTNTNTDDGLAVMVLSWYNEELRKY
jgi:hypothetical protein